MRDQTPGRSNDSNDDAFNDALDDLFGPEEHEAAPNLEPEPDAPPDVPLTATPPEPAPMPAEPTHVGTAIPHASEPRQGRSMVQLLGFGCAGVLVLIFVCLVILAVIGATVGDPAVATSTT